MNHETLSQPELNAARIRVQELDKAAARISMAGASFIDSGNPVPVVEVNSAEKTYSYEPATVISLEEHKARKNVADVIRQQDSFPLPQVNSAEKTYSYEPASVTSLEEHKARKNVADVYRQQNSFPLPQDNNQAA